MGIEIVLTTKHSNLIPMKKTLLFAVLLISNLSHAQNFMWFKRIETTGNDIIPQSVSNNTNGEIIHSGLANSGTGTGTIDFDPGAASYTLTSAATLYNVWVNRLDVNGNFLWAKMFNVNNNGNGKTVARINSLNEVIVGARFTYTADFDPGPGTYTMATANPSGVNGFVAKLNSGGSFAWAFQFRQLTPNSTAFISDIEFDNANNIYVCGYFSGSIDFDPSTTGTTSIATGYASDAWTFIVKLDNAGNFKWVKTFNGSPSVAKSAAMAFDSNKNILVGGSFTGTIDFDPGVSTYTLSSQNNAPYIAKLDSSGNFVWAKQFVDNINFHNVVIPPVSDIQTDSNNDVYLTGCVKDSLDFDPSTSAYYLKAKGAEDIYVAKLSSAGNLNWAVVYGANGSDVPNSLTIDNGNNIYVASEFPVGYIVDCDPGVGVFTITPYASTSIAINKLSSSGNFVSNSYFVSNSSGADYFGGMTMDNANNLLVHGRYSLVNLSGFEWVDFDPGTPVVKGLASSTSAQGFLVKLSVSGVGIYENELLESKVRVYPNPAKDLFKVDLAFEKTATIEIYNSVGQLVYISTTDTPQTIISTERFSSGIYFIVVSSDSSKLTKKIIIE